MPPTSSPRDRLLYEILCAEIQGAAFLEAHVNYLGTLVRHKLAPYWTRYVAESPRLTEEARLSLPRWEEVAATGMGIGLALYD